jgi:hypothetical protein
VLEEFRHHPEAKSADVHGRQCGRQTRGLLLRRRVSTRPELLTYVGKESNKLDEVESGLEHDPDEIYTEYRDPRRDPLWTLVLPVLPETPTGILRKQPESPFGASERFGTDNAELADRTMRG